MSAVNAIEMADAGAGSGVERAVGHEAMQNRPQPRESPTDGDANGSNGDANGSHAALPRRSRCGSKDLSSKDLELSLNQMGSLDVDPDGSGDGTESGSGGGGVHAINGDHAIQPRMRRPSLNRMGSKDLDLKDAG